MENTFLEKLNNTKLFKLMSIEKSIVEGKLVEFTESDISDYNTKMLHELKDLVEYLNTNTDPNDRVFEVSINNLNLETYELGYNKYWCQSFLI